MKLRSFIILAALPIFLTGCASTGRVHDKNYLRAVAIEGSEEKKLTFTFFTEDSAIECSGKDIPSAQREAEIAGGKEIFTGYTELVVLNDCDYEAALSFLLHDWKVPPSCLVVLGDGELLGEIPAETLTGAVQRAQEQGIVQDCGIVKVLGALLNGETAHTAYLQ